MIKAVLTKTFEHNKKHGIYNNRKNDKSEVTFYTGILPKKILPNIFCLTNGRFPCERPSDQRTS
jgi:hypothetical protein